MDWNGMAQSGVEWNRMGWDKTEEKIQNDLQVMRLSIFS